MLYLHINSSWQIPGEIVDVLVVRESLELRFRRQLRLISDTWFNALDYISNHPKRSAKLMSRRLRIAPKQVLKSLRSLEIPVRSKTIRFMIDHPPPIANAAQRLQATMLAHALLETPINLSSVFTPQCVRE